MSKLLTPMYINICKKSFNIFPLLLMSLETVPGVGPLLITPMARIGHCDHTLRITFTF